MMPFFHGTPLTAYALVFPRSEAAIVVLFVESQIFSVELSATPKAAPLLPTFHVCIPSAVEVVREATSVKPCCCANFCPADVVLVDLLVTYSAKQIAISCA